MDFVKIVLGTFKLSNLSKGLLHCTAESRVNLELSKVKKKIKQTKKQTYKIKIFGRYIALNTLKSVQGTFTPVGAQGGGGVPWNPPEKTTFPLEFCNEICTIYVQDIKNHNSAKKKNFKCCTVSKWRPNNRFLFRVISILAKFWKTTFPKELEFFNEIWLKEGEYE